jgi:hypothetical protein
MRKIKNNTKNYVYKIDNRVQEYLATAKKEFTKGNLLQAILNIACASREENRKLTIINHGKEIKYFETNTKKLTERFNEIQPKNAEEFMLNLSFVNC